MLGWGRVKFILQSCPLPATHPSSSPFWGFPRSGKGIGGVPAHAGEQAGWAAACRASHARRA